MFAMFGGGPHGFQPNDDTPVKQFTREECLEKVIEFFKDNIGYVRNNCDIPSFDEDLYINTLNPATTDPSMWDDISTIRPNFEESKKYRTRIEEAGGKIPSTAVGRGTNMIVRVFENTEWETYDKGLRVTVITEHGHIIGTLIEMDWDQSFFI